MSVDIDECEVDKTLCPDATQVCLNVPGSYRCDCALGYKKKAGQCAGQLILTTNCSIQHTRYNISHRPLKLRTDGAQSRVLELGFIDLFVVTSLKMNELSPNLEHKLPTMCGILAANFFAI